MVAEHRRDLYRLREDTSGARLNLLPPAPDGTPQPTSGTGPGLLHPKYRLPSVCFAHVRNAGDPKTWHLPYLRADGSPDLARLPKAIQAILSNYRGAHVSPFPRSWLPWPAPRISCASCQPRSGQAKEVPLYDPRGAAEAAGMPKTRAESDRRMDLVRAALGAPD